MIKNKVLLWVNETFGNTGVTFQQDGATFHTATLVQDFCEKNFKNFWARFMAPIFSQSQLNEFWNMVDIEAECLHKIS